MKKEITVRELVAELVARIDAHREIDCCKEEIKTLARLAAARIPDEKVMVEWKD